MAGRERVRDTPEAKAGATTRKLTDAVASRSGHLAYSYGTCEHRAKAGDEKPSGRGHYVRIRKRTPVEPWRIVLDITNPGKDK